MNTPSPTTCWNLLPTVADSPHAHVQTLKCHRHIQQYKNYRCHTRQWMYIELTRLKYFMDSNVYVFHSENIFLHEFCFNKKLFKAISALDNILLSVRLTCTTLLRLQTYFSVYHPWIFDKENDRIIKRFAGFITNKKEFLHKRDSPFLYLNDQMVTLGVKVIIMWPLNIHLVILIRTRR